MAARLLPSWALFAVSASWLHAAEPMAPAVPHPLVWEAMTQAIDAKPGEDAAEFVFSVQNTSAQRVEIRELRPSCGCTVAELPEKPWILAPGARGSFRATADFKGKQGKFVKTIHVVTPAGAQVLTLEVNIPDTPEARRARNQQLAAADRQAVFRGECAACHATPAAGKLGGELFAAACGVCHTAAHRASMVPDLGVARQPRDAAYWRTWIADGKQGTLMPGFARAHGGPLSDEQIESLIAFALQHLPTQPAAN